MLGEISTRLANSIYLFKCIVEILGTYDFDTYFSALAKHGGTYTRLWLTDAYMDGLAVEIAIGVFNLTNLW